MVAGRGSNAAEDAIRSVGLAGRGAPPPHSLGTQAKEMLHARPLDPA